MFPAWPSGADASSPSSAVEDRSRYRPTDDSSAYPGKMQAELASVLDLQRFWTNVNTPEMKRRGMIVRGELPNQLRPLVQAHGGRWTVEGRDGTGRKSEIPCVRIFDAELSPSATVGWYVVYLFSADGQSAWLSLNQGTTTWMNGEFQARPLFELNERVQWARRQVGRIPIGSVSAIDLRSQRTGLGPLYEAGNVAAIEYRAGSIPNDLVLAADLDAMLDSLSVLLAASAGSFDEPGEIAADLASSMTSIDFAVSPRRSRGFRLSTEERKAIEVRAVDVAGGYLEDLGYKVKDVGATDSYDLHATRRREQLRVEVKGTVGDGSEVILTRNEVTLHRAYHPNTMLAVVSRIELHWSPLIASGGTLRTIHPWSPEQNLLVPLAYSYQVPQLE